ncbi:kinesin-like protein KIN12B-like, partial [Trifolium medium]|nr:kinesin-like protein KIN12B-like [Trifolium medium]
MREKELENVCKKQAARIEQLNQLVEKLKGENNLNSVSGTSANGDTPYIIEEKCEIKEVQEELARRDIFSDSTEKESLLLEIQKKLETELDLEKKCTEEMDDALKRAVNGHARM